MSTNLVKKFGMFFKAITAMLSRSITKISQGTITIIHEKQLNLVNCTLTRLT